MTSALLSGCGSIPVPAGAPSGSEAQLIAPASDAGGPLLYVAHRLSGQSETVVSIISLSRGKELARITGYTNISGVCSDDSGNVWVPNMRGRRWYIDKFARGSTKVIDELTPHPRLSLGACTVDPSSGNLAVMGTNRYGANEALIWSGPPAGKPAMYSVPFCTVSAGYDDADNLFITGWACGSTFNAFFGELAKGSGKVAFIKIDQQTGPYGGVQWDGQYLAVALAVHEHSKIYRVQVSGTTGNVVGVVRPQRFYVGFFGSVSGLFVLHHGTIIGTAGKRGDGVWAWPYPAGGKRTQPIARYESITGIALSI